MGKWISVNEKLPQEGMEVLVYLPGKGGRIKIDFMDTESQGKEDPWNTYVKSAITHWMPLPEAPK